MARTWSDTAPGSRVTGRWVDNVALERQFLADHPGSVIERLPGDPARAILMRFAGRLGDQDGGGEATGTDLGDVLRRLGQLAAGHAHPATRVSR
jgi:hypothetical protein